MSGWLAIAGLSLAVASLASAGARSLRRFSRSKMEELGRQEQTRPLYSQIVALRDRTVLGADSLQVLLLLVAVASAATWWQSAAGELAAIATVGVWLAGLLLTWFAIVWLPATVSSVWADPFVLGTWGLWKWVARLLAPSIWAAEGLGRLVRRLSGRHVQKPTEESLEEEILTIVNEGQREGLFEDDAREMIEGVIELGDATVAQIMTPRTDIASIHVGLAWDEVVQIASQAGHTRIPVYNKSPDDIVGILHTKDLLAEMARPDAGERRPWRDILRKPFFVPETKPVDDLLQEFQRSRNHLAVVLDEFGGVSGLVTIEDALEEIVGEIADEHDEAHTEGIRQLGEHSAEALARVRIAELNERLGLSLPEDEDYDTIGGFVFHELGRIPNVGEELVWQDVRIKVLEATRRRIDRVAIQFVSHPPQPTA